MISLKTCTYGRCLVLLWSRFSKRLAQAQWTIQNQHCWESRKFLQRLMVCVSLIGALVWKRWENLQRKLTVRPSLFLPPSVYKLPSFGSGRNAGLGFKQQLKTIKKRSAVLLREQESNYGQYQLSREVHLTPSNTVCFDFVLPNQTKPGSIMDKEQLSELSNLKRETKVLTQTAKKKKKHQK